MIWYVLSKKIRKQDWIFFYLDGAYVDMDSVLCNNPAPDINASKPEAIEILNLILGNNSIFDTQNNVDSTDGKIVILKPCWLP